MSINQEVGKLVSFRLCPFVVRSQIVAAEKGIALDCIYIDLDNKPEWFTAISPTLNVPALIVGDKVLFESAVICEFIDGLTTESLFPADSVLKHYNKSWIEFISTAIFQQYGFMTAGNETDYKAQLTRFEDSLAKIENIIDCEPFFNGTRFSVIDAAIAPLLYRVYTAKKLSGHDSLAGLSKLKRWAGNILAKAAVKKFLNDGFESAFIEHLAANNAWLPGNSR